MASRRPNDPPRPANPTRPASPPRATEIPNAIKADDAAAAAPARKPAPPRPRKGPTGSGNPVSVSEDIRRGMIAEAAYLRAERRAFVGGNEEEDWLAAEAEVDALLKARHGGTSQ